MSFASLEDYDGSKLFSWLSDLTGLPIDLLNFLLTQVFAMLAASAMRGPLRPFGASPAQRHIICLFLGIICGYFCFGRKALHLALLPLLCYVTIGLAPLTIMANCVLAVAIVYLSIIHLHRQFFVQEAYNLDITGPLMVITQRVTSLAYCVQDGRSGDFNSKAIERNRAEGGHEILKETPSILEFFSYSLAFQTLLCGPALSFPLYIDFIHGKQPEIQVSDEPNRRRAIRNKLLGVIVVGVLHLILSSRYPLGTLAGETPLTWSRVYLLWFCYVATFAVRCKYYLAWLLADIVCNSAGIGFSSPGKWDRVSNVDIIGFETSTTFREAVARWNPGTNSWLRMVIYERVRSAQLLKTYALSAIWHGFYPGYYVTFGTGALFTLAARKMRRFAQPFTWSSSRLYDALAFTMTRIFMTYATVPFVLLDFAPSFALYKQVFFCLHFIALGALFLPSPKPNKISSNGNVAHKNGKIKAS